MKIKTRGLTRVQIIIGSVLGVASGTYVWKPILQEKFEKESPEKQGAVQTTEIIEEINKDEKIRE